MKIRKATLILYVFTICFGIVSYAFSIDSNMEDIGTTEEYEPTGSKVLKEMINYLLERNDQEQDEYIRNNRNNPDEEIDDGFKEFFQKVSEQDDENHFQEPHTIIGDVSGRGCETPPSGSK